MFTRVSHQYFVVEKKLYIKNNISTAVSGVQKFVSRQCWIMCLFSFKYLE